VEEFTPTPAQITAAQELLDAVEKADIANGGVIVLPDGRMADPAMIGRARELTTLMQEIESHRG